MEKQSCHKCGKCITSEKGETVAAMSIVISITDIGDKDFAQKQLGRYELGKTYRICYECTIDNMLGK